MIEALVILKKYWWVGIIVALAFFCMFEYADIKKKETDLANRTAQVKDLTKSNEDAALTINRFAQQRIDNDAIADMIASRIKITNTRETDYKTIIQKAVTDAKVASWATTPVPVSVRNALQADRSKPSAP